MIMIRPGHKSHIEQRWKLNPHWQRELARGRAYNPGDEDVEWRSQLIKKLSKPPTQAQRMRERARSRKFLATMSRGKIKQMSFAKMMKDIDKRIRAKAAAEDDTDAEDHFID